MDADTPKTTSALPTDGSSTAPSERRPSRLTYEKFEDEINAAPLHLHAMRTSARLQGNISLHSTNKVTTSRSRSSSRSRPSSRNASRDTSPCPSDIAGGLCLTRASSTNSSIAGDMDSSITSGGVHINIDPDILLDRLGMDASPTMNDSCSGSIKSLPCLNERMSEESLDDCHAFTDLRNVIRNDSGSIKSLPCLNERMSEESLDDCHAFTDLRPTMNDSLSGSIKSLPCLNERMSEESLDDCHAFTDLRPTMSDSLSGSIKFLPCLNERMSEEALDDCHAFTDLRNVIRNDSGSIKSLPCLNERMSEEALDDCHAFTDLRNVIRQIPSASAGSVGSDPARSRDGSVTGGSILGDASCLLETLEEFEEESDGGDEINASSDCEDNRVENEIPALGFKIKHNVSLNATNVDKLG